jgi:hypothetical protein
MAAPGFRGTPPPFPWPALWAQVAEQGGKVYGQRWLVPRGALARQPAARPAAAPEPARDLVFVRSEAGEEEFEDAVLDEDSDSDDSGQDAGGTDRGAESLDGQSLHLDGEGEIVLTDEWRDRLVRAAVKRAHRVAAAAQKEAEEDSSEEVRGDQIEQVREGSPGTLGDFGGVMAQEAAKAEEGGPVPSSPAGSILAGGVGARASEAPYDRFLRGKYGREQARRFAVQEAALSATLAARGGGQHSGLAYWPK